MRLSSLSGYACGLLAVLFVSDCKHSTPVAAKVENDSMVGAPFECGLGHKVTKGCDALKKATGFVGSAALDTVCSAYGESFFACSGVPGTAGVECEVCAGIGSAGPVPGVGAAGLTDATLLGYGFKTDGGYLSCWTWEYESGSTAAVYKGRSNVYFGGGTLSTPVASIACGGYHEGASANNSSQNGNYCTAMVGANLFGLAHCEIGLIMVDPLVFFQDLDTISTYDKVVSEGPCPGCVTAGCYPGETMMNVGGITGRCRAAINKMDSTATSNFGYAISCSDAFQNKCYNFADCPDSAFKFCSDELGGCIKQSLNLCPNGGRPAGDTSGSGTGGDWGGTGDSGGGDWGTPTPTPTPTLTPAPTDTPTPVPTDTPLPTPSDQ